MEMNGTEKTPFPKRLKNSNELWHSTEFRKIKWHSRIRWWIQRKPVKANGDNDDEDDINTHNFLNVDVISVSIISNRCIFRMCRLELIRNAKCERHRGWGLSRGIRPLMFSFCNCFFPFSWFWRFIKRPGGKKCAEKCQNWRLDRVRGACDVSEDRHWWIIKRIQRWNFETVKDSIDMRGGWWRITLSTPRITSQSVLSCECC